MLSDAFFGLVALLYYGCFALLVGLVFFIAYQGGRRPHTRAQARLRRRFFLLALCLMLWQVTLFLEVRTTLPAAQLWLGRGNFAAVVFAAFFSLRFVEAVPEERLIQRSVWRSAWVLATSGLLAAVTLLTPLVDAAERIEARHAISTYGPLFPVYLLHALGCLTAALVVAFRERRRADDGRVRGQLTLIGLGMLATGGVAFLTNVVLPYGFGDFRFCDVGTLSTLCFVLAVAYATFVHGLFDPRVILRETLVFGILMAFVMGAYSSIVFLLTQCLTHSAGKLTQFVVLLIAFSLDPLRRFLEKKTDRLLFGRHEAKAATRKRRGRKLGRRTANPFALTLLLPWR
jgi:hypothetical protein